MINYGRFVLLLTILMSSMLFQAAMAIIDVKVGVVANSESVLGKIGLTSINISLSDFYSANPNYKTRLVLHTRDSPNNDVVGSADAVLDLIKNVQVGAIIGPEKSQEAQFDIELGEKARVPIISYSATSSQLSSVSDYFIQATQNDSSQISAIAAIIQAFGWRQVVPVYVDNEFGGGFIPYLTDGLQQVGIRIPYRSVIPQLASNEVIRAELYKLQSMPTRVFVVHMDPTLGKQLFSMASEIGMLGPKADDYAWIITNGIGNWLDDFDSNDLESMQGIVGVRTYAKQTRRRQDFEVRWKRKFKQDFPQELDMPKMNVYGLWAYDTLEALARAVEDLNISDFTFSKTSNGSTDLSRLEESLFGPDLLLALQRTKFSGLSGKFQLINRQMQSSTFEVVNVIGNGKKTIGFWIAGKGLMKSTDSANRSSIPKNNLYSILWPGDQNNPPKGWVPPVNDEKKLKVMVPIKDGFTQFVDVTTNSSTNTTTIKGYCIDIFDAVMQSLPYPVPYEYVPFGHKRTMSYDELVKQVYYHKADIVAGDVTIVKGRAEYVDFTLPFTESGVSMLAPLKDNNKKRGWLFLRPLSWDLWVSIFCFFVFIAFTLWILEHRINPEFRGPPAYQAGTALYNSFATLVFSNNVRIFSNWARAVVIVWIFVVLILTQSYTASLTSMLTVQQLQPAVTNKDELIKTRQPVGYQEGSFVRKLLIDIGFREQQLKSFRSAEDLHHLFFKGPGNDGIAAAFDEISYLKLFLATYCSKYVMVPPTYKTAGFGFAFPIGSPLVDDVSRAVLNVTEGEQMTRIESVWMSQEDNCKDLTSSAYSSSSSLGLDSFWVLFTIAGAVAACALIAFFATFCYQQREVWGHPYPGASLLTRMKELFKIFDQKNLESHTFRKSEVHDVSQVGASTSNNTRCHPSPSIFSEHTEGTFGASTNQSGYSSPDRRVTDARYDEDAVIVQMSRQVAEEG